MLAHAGAEVAATAPDVLTIKGLSAERTVAALTAHRVPFTEVSAHRASLEEAYMELTRDAVEFRAAASPRERRHDHHARPYRSTARRGRDGFGQLLHAEWTKFRTVRGWVIGTIVAVLMTAGIGIFVAAGGASQSCQAVGGAGQLRRRDAGPGPR